MYAHAVSALLSAPRNHMNPTSVISGPMRFSGRRHQAKMPAPAKLQPNVSASTSQAVGSRSRSLVVTSASAASPSARPAMASPMSARRRPLMSRR